MTLFSFSGWLAEQLKISQMMENVQALLEHAKDQMQMQRQKKTTRRAAQSEGPVDVQQPRHCSLFI